MIDLFGRWRFTASSQEIDKMPVIDGVLVAIPAPKYYVVDFDHPKRQSVTASYAISGVGMIISTAFMLQRLYVKHYLRNTLGFDDCKLETFPI